MLGGSVDRGADGARHPEIGHDRVAGGQEDVARLDVAVHDPVAVGVTQRAGHVAHDLHRVRDRQLLLPGDPHAEGFARHEGHDEVRQAIGLAGIQERQDVGMGQPGDRLDFPDETVDPHLGDHLGSQDLDGHQAAMLQVLGPEHDGGGALAYFPVKRIAVPQGEANAFKQP